MSPRVQCDGDGAPGALQALYAHASDVPDRFAAYADSFRQWAADADRIVRTSAIDTDGERHIRYVTDTPDCRVKVVKVTIDPADDDTFDATITALKARGWNLAMRKYLVFVDANVICGQGQICGRRLSRPDQPQQRRRRCYARVDAGCWGGAVAAHEVVHNLGGVQIVGAQRHRAAGTAPTSTTSCVTQTRPG